MNAGTGPARGLKLALIGSRGVPNRYGGYETLMEELAARLVARGHQVTVYCRSHTTPRGLREYRGARLVRLPTVRSKHLDTPVHTFLSALHASAERFDAALVVNSANALFVPLLTAAGIATALHVDGIEKRRAKWGAFGRAVYALSERLACAVGDVLVTDAEVIRRHYRARYGADSWMLTYGTLAVDRTAAPTAMAMAMATPTLERLGCEPGRYFLYVSRFERENNPHRVAAAYRDVGGDLKLVMVGGAPYASDFISSFTRDADPRVLFPGAIYGEGYRELLTHALAYVHATEVGGTHPALVEAMGAGNCVVVHRTPENEEVAGDAGLYFDAHRPVSLSGVLERLRRDPEEARQRGQLAAARAKARFDWDEIAAGYERLFFALSGGAARASDRPGPPTREITNEISAEAVK
jgi:glycosyltransferase involved in cell wall biosynthesis